MVLNIINVFNGIIMQEEKLKLDDINSLNNEFYLFFSKCKLQSVEAAAYIYLSRDKS